MNGQPGPEPDGSDRRDLVVVPHHPGPLISLEPIRRQRGHDDLDALIDDLFPDVEEHSGLFDAALVVVGAGLVAWGMVGGAPGFVAVLGVVALVLGCVLPLRAAWRRARESQQRRRREDLLGQGVPIDVASPGPARLIAAYEALLESAGQALPELGEPAIASGHFALLEAASLLNGRAPRSDSELRYVDRRAAALSDLATALGELPTIAAGTGTGTGADPDEDDLAMVDADTLIEAQDELDELAPYNSVTRLEELAAEVRQRRDRG